VSDSAEQIKPTEANAADDPDAEISPRDNRESIVGAIIALVVGVLAISLLVGIFSAVGGLFFPDETNLPTPPTNVEDFTLLTVLTWLAALFYFGVLLALFYLSLTAAARVQSNKIKPTRYALVFGSDKRLSAQKIIAVAVNRIESDNTRLHQLTYTNLMFGLFFCVLGLGILGASLFDPGEISLETFLPRLTVGLFVQLVGFFFLRLYNSGEAAVQRNQAEITTLDHKISAIALMDDEGVSELVKQLISEDRSFVSADRKRAVEEVKTDLNDLADSLAKILQARAGGQ